MRTRAVLGWALSLGVLATASACGETQVIGAEDLGTVGGAHDGAFVVDTDAGHDVQAEFEQLVQPLLLADCVGCHSQVTGGMGPGFLAANPDVLTSLLGFRGLIGATPEGSRLLTKPQHLGDSYKDTARLAPHALVIAQWIRDFAMYAPPQRKPQVAPFFPTIGATNTIELGALDSALAGMTITFTPTVNGSYLKLSELKVTATSGLGVRIQSPVFATYAPASPTVTVEVDASMLNYEQIVYKGTSAPLSAGLLLLPYASGQLIGVSFGIIESSMATPSMMGGTACKNLGAWSTFKPRLQAAQGNAGACSSCHNAGFGGFNTTGIANNAMDAQTCAAALLVVDLNTPAASKLYTQITDNDPHNGGKIQDPTIAAAFLADLTTFVNAEK